MNNVTVSIIVPVYNVEKYIATAVKSVTVQKFCDYEIILVNDGSTDKSGEICDDIAKGDERVRVIHKANGGISTARNAGLDVANGKYIFFLDPDDYCMGELLGENIAIAERYQCDMVIFGFANVLCDESGNETEQVSYYHNISGLYGFESFAEHIKEYFENVPNAVWNRIYRQNAIEGIRFNESLRTGEDAAFNADLITRGFKSVYYNNKIYYAYLRRKESLMNRYNPDRFETEMRINDKTGEILAAMGKGDGEYINQKYVRTALCEYTNITMPDCPLSDSEAECRLRAVFSDMRVKNAMCGVPKKEFGNLSLRYLFTLSKKEKFKKALKFKKAYIPFSKLMHSLISIIKRK